MNHLMLPLEALAVSHQVQCLATVGVRGDPAGAPQLGCKERTTIRIGHALCMRQTALPLEGAPVRPDWAAPRTFTQRGDHPETIAPAAIMLVTTVVNVVWGGAVREH